MVKRTTKRERREARGLWGVACQEFGTAYVARTGRNTNYHLALRLASALRMAPWHWYAEVPRPPWHRKHPAFPFMVEAWTEHGQIRWTRMDTLAWYTEPMMVAFIDHDSGEVAFASPGADGGLLEPKGGTDVGSVV